MNVDSHFPLYLLMNMNYFHFQEPFISRLFIQSAVTVLPEFALHHFPQEWKEHIFKKVVDSFLKILNKFTPSGHFLKINPISVRQPRNYSCIGTAFSTELISSLKKQDIDIKTFQGGIS